MDFGLPAAEEQFRDKIRAFLREAVTPELVEEFESEQVIGPRARGFMRLLGSKGWLAPVFPVEYGGLGASRLRQFIILEEMSYFRALPIVHVGVGIVGPTLLRYGSESQKREFLPRIAAGEVEFALGYTEPEAGSDLANLSIRATKDGDHYVVNGQKVFNTGCHYSEYVWLLARTSTDGPKSRGISLFMVDLQTPGITIRPLHIMDGERSNEVFYDNVRVPKSALVGEENKGFIYVITALAHERAFPIGSIRRAFEEFLGLVEQEGLTRDSRVRYVVGELTSEIRALELLAYRVAWMGDNDRVPEWEAPVVKLMATEFMKKFASAAIDIVGPRGLLKRGSPSAPLDGRLQYLYRHAARRTISGGTSEIMRNTIAQVGLHMPRN